MNELIKHLELTAQSNLQCSEQAHADGMEDGRVYWLGRYEGLRMAIHALTNQAVQE